MDWAALRRGFYVRLLRQMDGLAQVTFEENNRFPDPEYISYQVTGWVPEAALARTNRRSRSGWIACAPSSVTGSE